MHSFSKCSALLKTVLAQAEQMAAHLPATHHPTSDDILSFLNTFGCEGYPTGQAAHFNIGPWLARQGIPTKQHEGVTIVPYFSDDVPPIALPPQSQTVIPGQCLYTDQAILLYNVDHWSQAELALTLLHEGRHARHRIGPRLAQLPPLDPNDALHETNTWLFTLNILTAWGGKAWEAAIPHYPTGAGLSLAGNAFLPLVALNARVLLDAGVF